MKNIWVILLISIYACFASPSMYELKGWDFKDGTAWFDLATGDYDGDGIAEVALVDTALDSIYFISSPNNSDSTIESRLGILHGPIYRAVANRGSHYE